MCSLVVGPAIADPQLIILETIEDCLNTEESPQSCARDAACESPLFIEAYGPIEGAGRGWCEGHYKTLWDTLVSRAERRFRACTLDDLTTAGFRAEARSYRNFREARCDVVTYQNRRGVAGGLSAGTFCFVEMSVERVIDLNGRIAECAPN